MPASIDVGGRPVGDHQPVWIIAELGINHNGDLALVKKLIDAAVEADCDAVKLQKRDPERSTPSHLRDRLRETPWGEMSYLDYRKRIGLGASAFEEIHAYCRARGIHWFASCWDLPSIEFIERFNPICHKIASARLTDDDLLLATKRTGRPVVLSTGMSTMEEIRHAVSLLDPARTLLAHSTSSYPCAPGELNLRMIHTLQREFSLPVGYSGHEVGLQTTLAAVTLGAVFVERHLTLDRAMWGSDQAASVEPSGFARLVRDIRVIERALGDGVKKVYSSEIASMQRLRSQSNGSG